MKTRLLLSMCVLGVQVSAMEKSVAKRRTTNPTFNPEAVRDKFSLTESPPRITMQEDGTTQLDQLLHACREVKECCDDCYRDCRNLLPAFVGGIIVTSMSRMFAHDLDKDE